VVIHGLLNDGEAEACACVLGRKIGLENFRDVFGRDAVTRVRDFDASSMAGVFRRDSDG
jgi:hypothetical protein